ncbi:MAG: SWIM zinc finger family protein [Elusimicrobia bacterium]|nr:SWIM zinc finger family protein [Elusimicrobiota bacterium]
MSWYGGWRPYVSVAERRRKAVQTAERLGKKGQALAPVQIRGRGIADTFWGQAWCRNLESYSDYSNRLPRGRTYVRNGSVIDLTVDPGSVKALVMGSELYRITVTIAPLNKSLWEKIRRECGGKIASLLELLQGRLSQSVMETVSRKGEGLFPSPKEIKLSCSCPDWADMCKHVAATLYGVGARLDHKPELLFQLRKVDHQELIMDAGSATTLTQGQTSDSSLATADLTTVFGIDIDTTVSTPPTQQKPPKTPPVKRKGTSLKKPRVKPRRKRQKGSSRRPKQGNKIK